MLTSLLLALLASDPTAGEPHPFSPDDQALYDSLFSRFEKGERNLEAPLQQLLSTTGSNPRVHRLAGHYYRAVGDSARAQVAFERALALGIGPAERHADTLAALAEVIWAKDRAAAHSYLQRALDEGPAQPPVVFVAARLETAEGHTHEAREYLERLATLVPGSGEAQADLAAARWNDGSHLGAADAVQRARALGTQRDYFDQVESQTRVQRWSLRAGIGFGIAALVLTAALGLIALAGHMLSRAEVRSLADVHAHLEVQERTRAEARVDRVYSIVLWAAASLLFVAMPVLIVGTLALGGGLLWAMLSMSYVLVKPVVVVGVGTMIAVYGLMRGLFFRRPPGEGRFISRAEEPRLYGLLDEVATAARSKPVDQVVLQPGSGVGVREDGTTLEVLAGRGKRVLALGYGVLQQLTIGELRAVLAHEYGHLSHGETRLTPVLWRVEVSAVRMLMGMAASGRMVMMNPAFWFLRWYMRVYVRITRGHGRRRELLADRVAALTYGGDTFARALVNASAADQDLSRAIALLGTLRSIGVEGQTLYSLQEMKKAQTEAPLRAALAEERSGRTSNPFDTHPPVAERIKRVAGMQGTRPDDPRPAVTLLSNPDKFAIEVAAPVLARLPPPDLDTPQPLRPTEVTRAISSLQDAYSLKKHGLLGALAAFERSLEELSTALGAEHPFLAEHLRELGKARRSAGDVAGADAAAQRATAIDELVAKQRTDSAGSDNSQTSPSA
jgi:Zn-dependent protease with chaperone function/Tfp pilus assembly protein PilF